MKLVSTLPERPGFLHALPLFDLFGLLLVLFLLGPSFVNQSGVEVEMPVSRFRIESHAQAAVVTLTPGDPPVIWMERQRLSELELMGALERRAEEMPGVPVLYLRTDGGVAAGEERAVAEMALRLGYRVFLLGQAAEE